jgi:putative transposase
VDNGPEFIAQAMEEWAKEGESTLAFIQKPYQNGWGERFNRTYREEVLDGFLFDKLKQTQVLTNAWMWTYNNEPPHGGLKYHTQTEFLLKYGKLHQPPSSTAEFPTVQQDSDSSWNSLILNATT